MIINAHNFLSASFSPAVNGKMPLAAWIPSRDDAGNGSTTLTDLLGGYSGTLTSMTPSSDWPTDTAFGGVRALDFDGVNDRVVLPISRFRSLGTTLSISLWFLTRKLTRQVLMADWDAQALSETGRIEISGFGMTANRIGANLLNNANSGGLVQSTTNVTINAWHHVLITRSATQAKLYYDGALQATTNAAQNILAPSTNVLTIGRAGNYNGIYFSGRIDDIRIWNLDPVLDATDAADLWEAQRGGDVS